MLQGVVQEESYKRSCPLGWLWKAGCDKDGTLQEVGVETPQKQVGKLRFHLIPLP
jgi:hypothetical protein